MTRVHSGTLTSPRPHHQTPAAALNRALLPAPFGPVTSSRRLGGTWSVSSWINSWPSRGVTSVRPTNCTTSPLNEWRIARPSVDGTAAAAAGGAPAALASCNGLSRLTTAAKEDTRANHGTITEH